MTRVITVLGVVAASGAWADPNDIRIVQLGNPASPGANANFRAFARELGAAISSANLMPPETLGHAGFSITGEMSLAFLNAKDSSNGGCFTPEAGCFLFPTQQLAAGTPFSGPLLIPAVHVRKGLPFSFELGTRIGWVERSRMATITGELKWAVNEGFAYLPDVGIRLHATRLLNARDFDLTTGGFDLGVGKQFALGGMITLTPYIGWNLVWVGASSSTIDFRPERSQSEANATQTAQLTDTNVFDEVRFFSNSHNRFYGGLRFVGGIVQLGAEVSYSSLGKFQDATTGTERSLPGLWATNFTIGLDF